MKKIIMMMFLLSCMQLYAMDHALEVEKIKPQALILGSGESRVFAFLDPLCSKSQNYLEMIAGNEKLLKQKTFYLYLYRLPKFESDRLIEHIYSAKEPLQMMKKVMIGKFFPKTYRMKITAQGQKVKAKIKRIADGFGAKRRPYLLLFNKGSNYCKVSEGSAPCLDPSSKK